MPYAYALRTPAPDAPAMLVEATRGELQAYADLHGGNPHAAPVYPMLKRVSGDYAHRWVRQGGTHETALYIGEDRHGRERVLYARDSLS